MNASLFGNTVGALHRVWVAQEARFEAATPGAKSLNAWILPILVSTILYLPICWALKAYYKDRKPFPHRKPLILWNAVLSILSAVGSAVVLFTQPSVLLSKSDPVQGFIHPNVRLVVRIFCITKFLEFGDTFWLCVKKRPTIFLHLYHHVTVTLYCLHSVLLDAPYGHFFAFVNLNIHAVMYGYYGAAIAFKGNKTLAKMRPFITLSQLIQMFVGTSICVHELIHPCTTGLEINAALGFAMYVSYAYLFGDFFINNYKKHMNSVDTLLAVTPIAFLPVLVYALGWKELLFNPWTTAVAFAVTSVFAAAMGSGPLPYLSPLGFAALESSHYGVQKRAIRAFAKRDGIDNESYGRWAEVALRYSVLPVAAVAVDSLATSYPSIRSLPVIFTFWTAHGYLSGAFDRQAPSPEAADRPKQNDLSPTPAPAPAQEPRAADSAPSTPITSASRPAVPEGKAIPTATAEAQDGQPRPRGISSFSS